MAYSTFPTYDPDAASNKEMKPLRLRAPFGDGYTQTGGDGINPFEEGWSLVFTRDKADVIAIRDFLDALMTSSSSFFIWTPPDEAVAKKWELDGGGYQMGNPGNGIRSISFKVKRVFAA